eukprot:gene13866-19791_t
MVSRSISSPDFSRGRIASTKDFAGLGVRTLIVSAILVFGLHPAVAQDVCILQQREALEEFYFATGGPEWREQNNWLNNGIECNTTLVGENDNIVPVPAHCCWYGVSCCSGETCSSFYNNIPECNCVTGRVTRLSLTWNKLRGAFPIDSLQRLNCGQELRRLELHNNNLNGDLTDSISSLNGLWTLGLGYNNFSGTLPATISEVRSLKELDLTANTPGFTGRVPEGLCQGRNDSSSLTDIMISHNSFSDSLRVNSCNSLVMLDAQNNKLTGEMPSLNGYNNMHMLRLGNNNLTGTIPLSISKAPLMTVFYLPFNSLQGSIPESIGEYTYLTGLNLISNQLSGTIPEDLFRNLGSLQTLWLSENRLNGTISQNINNSRSLTDIDLSSNSLYGQIPEEMSYLANLGNRVDLRFNFLSCCGREFNGTTEVGSYKYFDNSSSKLPSFLAFSKFLVPVSEKNFTLSFMRCPMVYRVDTSDNVGFLLNFKIDPEYYLYENCRCEQYPWVLALIVLFATIIFLAGLVWFTCLRRGATRPAVVQSWINMQKRLRGYSNLMKEAPDLMTSALNIHNNVLRKSRWTNFGYTVEQEGDSFALVFYEAVDAVMFCLQTQQALMKQAWPEGLFKEEEEEEVAMRQSTVNPKKTSGGSQFLSSYVPQVLRKRKSAASRGGSLTAAGGNSSSETSIPATSSSLPQVNPDIVLNTPSDLNPDGLHDGDTAAADAVASRMSRDPTNGLISGPPFLALGGDGVRDSQSQSQSRKVDKGGPAPLFCGLRVRMGVATGQLSRNTQIRGCAVMEKCKVVSDAGAGGQVILDEETFNTVKDRLLELGAVDHNGINYSMLSKSPKSSPWHICKFWKKDSDSCDGDAPVLDMGTYIYSASKKLPIMLSTSEKARTFSRIKSFIGTNSPKAEEIKSNTPALASSVSKRAGSRGQKRISKRRTKEGQSKVEETAKVLGNKLALKDKYVCSDPPYFMGLLVDKLFIQMTTQLLATESVLKLLVTSILLAPFGEFQDSNEMPPPLPDVTVVYVGVEGGGSFVSKNRKESKQVHDTIVMVLRNVLRQVPGGYLCLFDETILAAPIPATPILGIPLAGPWWLPVPGGYLCMLDEKLLRYQLAFPSPESALTWCLMAQECLSYPDWADSALLQWSEERDAGNKILFRGPRFKMGVAVGVPKGITPNSCGLPDYQGDVVGSALRYMLGAAHGGQAEADRELSSAEPETPSEATEPTKLPPPAGSFILPAVKEDDSDFLVDPAAIALREGVADAEAKLSPAPDAAALPNEPDTGATTSAGGGEPSLSGGGASTSSPSGTAKNSKATPAPLPAPALVLNPKCRIRIEATKIGLYSFKGMKEQVRLANVTIEPLKERQYPAVVPKKGGGKRIAGGTELLSTSDFVMSDIVNQYRQYWYGKQTQPGIGALVDGRSSGLSLSTRLVRSMTNRGSLNIPVVRHNTGSHTSGSPNPSALATRGQQEMSNLRASHSILRNPTPTATVSNSQNVDPGTQADSQV